VNNQIETEEAPLSIYFIKNINGTYIGSVIDMTLDLHYFIIPSERKKGFLTKSLIRE